jgi:hypothetical protein
MRIREAQKRTVLILRIRIHNIDEKHKIYYQKLAVYLRRTIIRVEEDGLHLDSILGGLERRRAAQVNPLARLPVAGDGKPHVPLGGVGVGGQVQPGLLNVEEAVTLAEGTLLLQHAAAVHQGPLHAVRAPGQALNNITTLNYILWRSSLNIYLCVVVFYCGASKTRNSSL